MPGTLSKADLLDDLRVLISDVADYCEGSLETFLMAAISDFTRIRPRTLRAGVSLEADQANYIAPNDMYAFKVCEWGMASRQRLKPWEPGYPRSLPRVTVLDTQPKTLLLDPPPTAEQLSALGSQCFFYYYAKHELGDNAEGTTVQEVDRDLLLLRAQVEALRFMAVRATGKTVSAKAIVSGQPRAGHPAELAKMLMAEFERRAAC